MSTRAKWVADCSPLIRGRLKKRYLVLVMCVIWIAILNIFKHPFVFYTPFDILGHQMAITIPPFGMFMESQFETADANNPCVISTVGLIRSTLWKTGNLATAGGTTKLCLARPDLSILRSKLIQTGFRRFKNVLPSIRRFSYLNVAIRIARARSNRFSWTT